MAEAKAKRAPKATKEPKVKKETPASSQSSSNDSKKSKGTSVKKAAKSEASVNKDEKKDTTAAKQKLAAEEGLGEGWLVVRHPELKNTVPCYYVNIKGQIASKRRKMRIINPTSTSRKPLTQPLSDNPNSITVSRSRLPMYSMTTDVGSKGRIRLPLIEIMLWTFIGGIEKGKDQVFYKDGQKSNCALSNIIVCDREQLQQLEAQRLSKLQQVEFTAVKSGFGAFSNYLVGKNGQVYDIANQKFMTIFYTSKRSFVRLIDTSHNTRPVQVSTLVMESFVGPAQDGYNIVHLNDDIKDNSLENLKYLTKSQCTRLKKKNKPPAEQRPLPPVTKDTKWAVVGKVPWQDRTYSQYEVSNMGHFRKKGSDTPIYTYANCHMRVCLKPDTQKGDSAGVRRYYQESIARLVANSFVKPGFTAKHNYVKHLNGDSFDNSAKNLKWVEQKDALGIFPGYKVTVKLVDEPNSQKTFPSKRAAANTLACDAITDLKHGDTIEQEVLWDTDSKTYHLARIHVA